MIMSGITHGQKIGKTMAGEQLAMHVKASQRVLALGMTMAILAGAEGLVGRAEAQGTGQVAAYVVIQGAAPQRIGDGSIVWEKAFAAQRPVAAPAVLMVRVQSLTHAISSVAVLLNGQVVAYLTPFPGGWAPLGDAGVNADQAWYTEELTIDGSILRDGENRIQLQAVTFPGNDLTNVFDDFWVADLVCLYQSQAR
jgi:hypothetical protein